MNLKRYRFESLKRKEGKGIRDKIQERHKVQKSGTRDRVKGTDPGCLQSLDKKPLGK